MSVSNESNFAPSSEPVAPGSPEEKAMLASAREANRARAQATHAGVVAMMETIAPLGETPGYVAPERSREIHQIAVEYAGPQGPQHIQARHG